MFTTLLKLILDKEHERVLKLDGEESYIDQIELYRKLLKSGYYCEEQSGARKLNGNSYHYEPSVKMYISYRGDILNVFHIIKTRYDFYYEMYERIEKFKRIIEDERNNTNNTDEY